MLYGGGRTSAMSDGQHGVLWDAQRTWTARGDLSKWRGAVARRASSVGPWGLQSLTAAAAMAPDSLHAWLCCLCFHGGFKLNGAAVAGRVLGRRPHVA